MTGSARFDPDLLRFLGELRSHNNKPWFERNRARYEHVYRDGFAAFIEAFAPRLARISPYLVADARPVGGSVMRIYRDTRFSKDKSPYRTYTVVHFAHKDAGEGQGPGLFLYVSPDEISAGGGLWHPEPPVAQKIRGAILSSPAKWQAAAGTPTFRRRFELTGDSAKRTPSGVPVGHPLMVDLLRKDFVASTELTRAQFTSPGFVVTYEQMARQVRPLLKFLCGAVGLGF